MGIIHTRRMATSQPRNFNRGLPLLPLGALGHSINSPAPTQDIGRGTPNPQPIGRDLIDQQITLATWRLRAYVHVDVFTGTFFGLNIEYLVSGVTQDDGGGYIGLSGDRSAGGIAFGVSFDVFGSIQVEQLGRTLQPNGWQFVWAEIFNRDFAFNVDVVNIALAVLRAGTGGVLPIEIVQGAQTVGSAGAVWGLFDQRRDRMIPGRGSITYRPTLAFSPNMLPFIPGMRAVLTAFRLIGGRFSMGPTLNIVYPITFEVVRLVTEDGAYDVGDRSHVLFLVNGPRRRLPPTVSNVTIVHSHTTNLRFELGLHFTFAFLGLVNIDEVQALPLTGSGNGPRVLGPFFTQMNNSNVVAAEDMEMPEVVWG